MKMNHKFGRLLLILLLFTAGACSGDKSNGKVQAAEKKEGSTEYNNSYNFTTENLDGSPLRLSDYKGKVAVAHELGIPPSCGALLRLRQELTRRARVAVMLGIVDDSWIVKRPRSAPPEVSVFGTIGSTPVPLQATI